MTATQEQNMIALDARTDHEAGKFLLARLADFGSRIEDDELAREFDGHVIPAMARFRAYLAALASPAQEPVAKDGLDWLKVAKLAGQYGIRYRTNAALEAFIASLAAPPAPAPAQVAVKALVERFERQVKVALQYAADEKPKGEKFLPSVFELQIGHLRDIGREALAALALAEGQATEGMVLVPEAALKWLFGEGPDQNGHWFGDGEKRRGAFWWRTTFRELLALAAPAVQS